MRYEIRKAWFRNRWHVYEVGHLEGDWTWVASFKFFPDAELWAWGPSQ